MRKSIQKIQKYKLENKKITVLTAYDYSTAKYIDEAGADIVLIGDSLAMVALGYEDTINLSLNEMKVFVSAVSRGVESALVVADMPFGSFQADENETLKNAIELIKAGANAVKLEGASDYTLKTIKRLVEAGIPVMGHLGFTPMSINTIGGHKVQGKSSELTLEILTAAKKLQEAGCFSIVLELVPKEAAAFISKNILIPTIGIGAGVDCDGQVLVSDDLLGKFDRFKPKFARQYANLKETILLAVKNYINDVENKKFPIDEESFLLNEDEVKKLENYK